MASRSHLLSFTGLRALAGFTEAAAPTAAAAPAAAAASAPAPDSPTEQPADPVNPPAQPTTPPDDEPDEVSGANGQPVVLASSAIQLANEARAQERVRVGAVFASPEGRANASTAAFLLCHSDATADQIVAQLKAAPSAAAGGGAASPRINLTGGNGAATAGDEATGSSDPDGAAGGFDVWAELARRNGTPAPGASAAAIAGSAAPIVAPTLNR